MTKDRKPRGEAAPWKDGRKPKVTCTARTVAGVPCKRPPIKGSNVCRTHGGAAPQVRAAAQVRILMSADAAAAKLIEMIHSKKVADNVKLAAVRDLLDRANLAGTQNIEVGVTKRTFEDFIGDAIIDVEPDDYDNVFDAEVIEDDPEPLVPRDEANRHDRAVFAEVERSRAIQPRPGAMSESERRRIEAEALGLAPRSDRPRRKAGARSDDVQAMNAQQDAEDAELERVKAAERRRNEERRKDRRPRTSEATISQAQRRGERR